jgi:hypothetical protein
VEYKLTILAKVGVNERNLKDLEIKSNPTTMAQVEDKPTILAKVGVMKEMQGDKFKSSLTILQGWLWTISLQGVDNLS